ncbi:MAG: hypothetical protein II007_09500 [Gammaproteobacteria bacterium]|nr:hypothetical protein [Gammaproteobacteria bacterium]
MARQQKKVKHAEEIDSSPAGIARAFCVKGNADAEIAIARTRICRGGVSISFIKSLLPPPAPAAPPTTRITLELPAAVAAQLRDLVSSGSFADEQSAVAAAIEAYVQHLGQPAD